MQILNEQDRRRVILAVSLLAGIVVMVAILGFMGLLAPLVPGDVGNFPRQGTTSELYRKLGRLGSSCVRSRPGPSGGDGAYPG